MNITNNGPDNNHKNHFKPVSWLKNSHLMTVIPVIWPRSYQHLKKIGEDCYFKINEETTLLARCHFVSKDPSTPTLIIIHGLEGSSNSRYVLGLSAKALSANMNVIRLNLRNCGDTLHLTPTFYNAGQSGDIISVVSHLYENLNFKNIFLLGYSLGGNIALKAGAEMAMLNKTNGYLKGIGAISPSIDLSASIKALNSGINKMYELRFLLSLKYKVIQKNRFFPGKFNVSVLPKIKDIRAFDDYFTAPDGGFADSTDYYQKASSLSILDKITIPTIIVTAKDDPIIPYSSFLSNQLKNPAITLLAPDYGGHGGFIHNKIEHNPEIPTFDRFWAENRILEFCLEEYKKSLASVKNHQTRA